MIDFSVDEARLRTKSPPIAEPPMPKMTILSMLA